MYVLSCVGMSAFSQVQGSTRGSAIQSSSACLQGFPSLHALFASTTNHPDSASRGKTLIPQFSISSSPSLSPLHTPVQVFALSKLVPAVSASAAAAWVWTSLFFGRYSLCLLFSWLSARPDYQQNNRGKVQNAISKHTQRVRIVCFNPGQGCVQTAWSDPHILASVPWPSFSFSVPEPSLYPSAL